MTTICYFKEGNKHNLYADSRICRGDYILSDKYRKLFSSEKFIAGSSGDPSVAVVLKHIAKDLAIREELFASDTKMYSTDEDGVDVEVPYTHETEIVDELDLYRLMSTARVELEELGCWESGFRSIICIRDSNRVYEIQYADSEISIIEVYGDFYSVGSGANVANMAQKLIAKPVDILTAVMSSDPYTGGDITHLSCSNDPNITISE